MSVNIETLSESELSALVDKANQALRERQASKRKETLAQIMALAASVGVAVEILEKGPRPNGGAAAKGSKVAVKFRDPANPKHKWTGRGMAPVWLRALEAGGRSREEFRV